MKVPRRRPVRVWLDTAYVMTGLPVAAVLLVLTIVTALRPRWLLRAMPRITRVQRSRLSAFVGQELPPMAPVERMRDHRLWRQIGFHVQAPLLSAVAVMLVGGLWGGGLVGVTGFLHPILQPPPLVFLFDLRRPVVVVLYMAAGLLMLILAPLAARAMTALEASIAQALLGPSHSELGKRIENLQESRAEVIDAADAERRRIERDLHDGAQQRLVSLAMNLGLARATLTDLPDDAKTAIAQAHEEAKQALKELRDFVRGLHPAVLNDQGLDAALSGVAARSPVPVRLRVEIGERVSPTIEAVAFFVVSEALTNIAKHAGATRAEITVRRRGAVLTITVVDDGRGGASLEGGTGLRGLRQRVGSVDGTLRLESPLGGPTMIEVELPCE
ncbi:sensor histidine kinase [Nonomuraea sp. NBC_01738]|uniref:sensor histidine kinase n=1 Tax=Nonomuraea sp. NBC_01738 TaxID=2976003 RepID=UPI002E1553E1|nr:sensor histidine kinase [Nonomuraea sp. NBC_01738]